MAVLKRAFGGYSCRGLQKKWSGKACAGENARDIAAGGYRSSGLEKPQLER